MCVCFSACCLFISQCECKCPNYSESDFLLSWNDRRTKYIMLAKEIIWYMNVSISFRSIIMVKCWSHGQKLFFVLISCFYIIYFIIHLIKNFFLYIVSASRYWDNFRGVRGEVSGFQGYIRCYVEVHGLYSWAVVKCSKIIILILILIMIIYCLWCIEFKTLFCDSHSGYPHFMTHVRSGQWDWCLSFPQSRISAFWRWISICNVASSRILQNEKSWLCTECGNLCISVCACLCADMDTC